MKISIKVFVAILMLLIRSTFSQEHLFESTSNKPPKTRVLIASPVRQHASVLSEFLKSLQELDKHDLDSEYVFIDDNVEEGSRALLDAFAKSSPERVVIFKVARDNTLNETYIRHEWKEETIWKVASFKDKLIHYALQNNYDYLFLIDSDLILHPRTVQQLVESKKDIVSEIFWTRWSPEAIEQPQVWLYDFYTQHERQIGETLSPEEERKRMFAFFDLLRIPGLYEVGGLCACTLISREALKKGVSFKRIHNVLFWGEDRHFCIRAVALGLRLFVDTHYPAYHIYRDQDMAGIEQYKLNNQPKLVVPLNSVIY